MNSAARLAIVAAAAVIVAVVGMFWPSPSALATVQPSSPTAASVGIASESHAARQTGDRERNSVLVHSAAVGRLGKTRHLFRQVPQRADVAQQVCLGPTGRRGDHLLDDLSPRRYADPCARVLSRRLVDRLPISRPQCRRRPAPSSSRALQTSLWAGAPRSTWCSLSARRSAVTPGSSTPGERDGAVRFGGRLTWATRSVSWTVAVDGKRLFIAAATKGLVLCSEQGDSADRRIGPLRVAVHLRSPLRGARHAPASFSYIGRPRPGPPRAPSSSRACHMTSCEPAV